MVFVLVRRVAHHARVVARVRVADGARVDGLVLRLGVDDQRRDVPGPRRRLAVLEPARVCGTRDKV